MKYKKILVPYDGSDHAKAAAATAVDFAEAGSGVTIVMATVCQVPIMGGPYDLASAMGQDIVGCAREKSEAALKEGIALLPEGISSEVRMGIGSPGPTLQEIAEKEKCDLIIMGSRGMGQMKGLFMGSVSSWLVSHAHCPVLVVK